MAKKAIKFAGKVNASDPLEIDEVRLASVLFDFEHETITIHTVLVDTDTPRGAAIVGRRPVCIGMLGHEGICDKLEDDMLSLVASTGRVPNGGTIKDK